MKCSTGSQHDCQLDACCNEKLRGAYVRNTHAHDGKQHDHRHVEQERRGHTVGNVDIRRVNDGRDGRNGSAAADARSGGDEVAHLPVQAERFADEIADAKAGGQREKHDRQ